MSIGNIAIYLAITMSVPLYTYALTIHDHTLVMQAAIKNYAVLTRNLPPNPTFEQIGQQLLELNNVDDYTIGVVKFVMEKYPSVKSQISTMDPQHRAIVESIRNRLSSCTNVNEVIETLKSIRNSGEYNEYPEVLNALDIPIKLAEDGSSTIYNPNWPPSQQIEVKSIKGLLLSDLVGAIAGGITNGWLGAIVVGIASSILYLIGRI